MSKCTGAHALKISIKSSTIALAAALTSTTSFAEEAASSSDVATDAPTILVVGQKDTPIPVVPRGLSVSLGQEEFEPVKLHDDLLDHGETCCPNRVARLAKLAHIRAQIGYKPRPGSYGGKPSLAIDNTLDR